MRLTSGVLRPNREDRAARSSSSSSASCVRLPKKGPARIACASMGGPRGSFDQRGPASFGTRKRLKSDGNLAGCRSAVSAEGGFTHAHRHCRSSIDKAFRIGVPMRKALSIFYRCPWFWCHGTETRPSGDTDREKENQLGDTPCGFPARLGCGARRCRRTDARNSGGMGNG
jgi:hypothetical protein